MLGYSVARSPEGAAESSEAGQGIAPMDSSWAMAGPGDGLRRVSSLFEGRSGGLANSQRSMHWLWAPEQAREQRSKPVNSSHRAEGKEQKGAKPDQTNSISSQRHYAALCGPGDDHSTRRKQPPLPQGDPWAGSHPSWYSQSWGKGGRGQRPPGHN